MTPEERALLRQDELEMLDRAEKATPGPWRPCERESESPQFYAGKDTLGTCFWPGHEGTPEATRWAENITYDTVEFIAAARTDVPELLSRLAAARAGERWISVTERLPPESTPVEVRDMKRLDRAIAQLRGDEWLIETCSELVNIYPPKSWRPLAEQFPVAESEKGTQ